MADTPKYRFYCENLPMAASGDEIPLAATEAHHAVNVMRLRVGEMVELFDGAGNYCTGELIKASKRSCIVRVGNILQKTSPEAPILTICSALPKTSRQDWMVEKLTELSVNRFVPLVCDHSSVKIPTNRDFVGRWNKIAIAASRQCRRYWLPEVHAAVSLDEFLAARSEKSPDELTLMAHCDFESGLTKPLGDIKFPDNCRSLCVLVGPEGGWSQRECELAAGCGAEFVQLGTHIMRIETAAIAFAAAITALLQRS